MKDGPRRNETVQQGQRVNSLTINKRKGVSLLDYKEAFHGLNNDEVDGIIVILCKALVGKGFSYRQAVALLELAKERLKDAKI